MTSPYRLTIVALSAVLMMTVIYARPSGSVSPAQPARMLALTFEGLPFVDARADGDVLLSNAQIGVTEMLRVLTAHDAPAAGLVNEGQLNSVERDARTALLQQWVDGGVTLGNGTFAGGKFLAARESRITPFTIDSRDVVFNAPYAAAVDAEDPALMARLLVIYTDFVVSTTEFAEGAARQIFKRDIPQTLRLHANDLNSDALHEILNRLEARGYRLVTLDAAMADAAYATTSTLVTSEGPSWLLRWAQTLGVTLSPRDAPAPPAWVVDRGRQQP